MQSVWVRTALGLLFLSTSAAGAVDLNVRAEGTIAAIQDGTRAVVLFLPQATTPKPDEEQTPKKFDPPEDRGIVPPHAAYLRFPGCEVKATYPQFVSIQDGWTVVFEGVSASTPKLSTDKLVGLRDDAGNQSKLPSAYLKQDNAAALQPGYQPAAGADANIAARVVFGAGNFVYDNSHLLAATGGGEFVYTYYKDNGNHTSSTVKTNISAGKEIAQVLLGTIALQGKQVRVHFLKIADGTEDSSKLLTLTQCNSDPLELEILNLMPEDILNVTNTYEQKDGVEHFRMLYRLVDNAGHKKHHFPSCYSNAGNCPGGGHPWCTIGLITR